MAIKLENTLSWCDKRISRSNRYDFRQLRFSPYEKMRLVWLKQELLIILDSLLVYGENIRCFVDTIFFPTKLIDSFSMHFILMPLILLTMQVMSCNTGSQLFFSISCISRTLIERDTCVTEYATINNLRLISARGSVVHFDRLQFIFVLMKMLFLPIIAWAKSGINVNKQEVGKGHDR